MKPRDKFESNDADFDKLDEKIHQALKEEGVIIPTTVEDVRRAKARLKARPVTVPTHLRDSSTILEKIKSEEPAQSSKSLIEHHVVFGHENNAAKSSHKATSEFVEAVLIAQITRLVATPQFPLGHLRQNKMVYFAHRKADEDIGEYFLKKAAGPYSPRATYQGPERIAQENGYVKKAKSGKFFGFVAGDHIDKIDHYVSRYPVCAAVDWVVEHFLYFNKEKLELLATVDFAALELRQQRKVVTMENIRGVIATTKEWTAKLKREIFSDDNISQALLELRDLFPKTYA